MELISHVESQDFVGIGYVAEPKKSIDRLLTQRAQRLHAGTQQLTVCVTSLSYPSLFGSICRLDIS